VLHIDGDGDITATVASGLDDPRDLAVGPDGTLWVSQRGGVVGLREGSPVARIDAVREPHGVATDGTTVLIADPAGRRIVAATTDGGSVADVVTGAAVGSPVSGAAAPHAFTALEHDGAGFVAGFDGDGSIRHLRRAG
jgi:hypothetical protein